ncbi:MAG: hypothetical protein IJP90_14300, partial [Treponema sp.]|nr:hypothetical protein [Treponema sp.]
MNAERKTLDYGDFVPAKKKKTSLKIDEAQGSFVRVNPNVSKVPKVPADSEPKKPVAPASATVLSEKSPAPAVEPSVATDDFASILEEIDSMGEAAEPCGFILEEPADSIPKRADEIKKFLEDDKRSLRLEKNAIRLIKKYEQMEEIEIERNFRVKRPIVVNLVVIISFLLVLAVGGVTYAVSYFVTQDTRSNAEKNNLAINSRTASDTENRINSAVSSVTMFLDLMSTTGKDDSGAKEIEKLFFDRNKDIVAIYYVRADDAILFTSDTFIVSHEIENESVLAYMQQESESGEKAKNGTFEILNATPFFNVPLISLFCPVSSSSGEGYVAFLYSTAEIGESFASGSINQSFFVNNDGIALVHSDLEKMNSAADLSSLKIIEEMLSSPVGNGQIPYTDENGDEYIGAFRKLGIGNGGVITIAKTSVILEGVRRITYRNICIMFAVVAIAILVIYFFAKSLSKPLQVLTEVVNEVNKGNFNTELFDELKLKRKDEIGVLERSTKNEREILNMVSRLTNKGVTKAVITKKIDFDPHLKDITIFFSDIRGFTAISDGFKKRFGEHSAAEIIGFLNDYMSRMV